MIKVNNVNLKRQVYKDRGIKGKQEQKAKLKSYSDAGQNPTPFGLDLYRGHGGIQGESMPFYV